MEVLLISGAIVTTIAILTSLTSIYRYEIKSAYEASAQSLARDVAQFINKASATGGVYKVLYYPPRGINYTISIKSNLVEIFYSTGEYGSYPFSGKNIIPFEISSQNITALCIQREERHGYIFITINECKICDVNDTVCDPGCDMLGLKDEICCTLDDGYCSLLCSDINQDGIINISDSDGICDPDCYNNEIDGYYDIDCVDDNNYDNICDPDSVSRYDGICDLDCANSTEYCDFDCIEVGTTNGCSGEGDPCITDAECDVLICCFGECWEGDRCCNGGRCEADEICANESLSLCCSLDQDYCSYTNACCVPEKCCPIGGCCGENESCSNDICCAIGEIGCGSDCCDSNEFCYNNDHCCLNNQTGCGDTCCDSDKFCANESLSLCCSLDQDYCSFSGGCCAPEKCCLVGCCPGDYVCSNDVCCLEGEIGCGSDCCDSNEFCYNNDHCCLNDQIGCGDTCCNATEVCSNNHCCPVDEPNYCENPSSGAPRCMNETEYQTECPQIKLTILIVPVNWDGNYSDYNTTANRHADYFLERIPLSECSDKFRYLKADGPTYGPTWENWYCYIPSVNGACYNGWEALQNIYNCAEEYKNMTGEDYDYVVGIDDSDIAYYWGYCRYSVGGWSDGYGGLPSVIVEATGAYITTGPSITTHELGHEFNLRDEYCDCSGTAYASYCGPTATINPLNETLGCKAGDGEGCCWGYGNGPYDPDCGWCYGNFDRFGVDTDDDGILDQEYRSAMSNRGFYGETGHHDTPSYSHLETLSQLQC